MLPPEVFAHVCEYLELEDVVALGHSLKWAIPEHVYQKKLTSRCPSFSPETTQRTSWAECARVHVSRLNNYSLTTDQDLIDIRGKVSRLKVSRNVPLPEDFEPLLDGLKTNFFEYLPGNRYSLHGETRFFGNNSRDTTAQQQQQQQQTPTPLVTSTGVEMKLPHQARQGEETVVMTDTSIGFVSKCIDDYWYPDRRMYHVAFKFGTPGFEADAVKTLEGPEVRWASPLFTDTHSYLAYVSCEWEDHPDTFYLQFELVNQDGFHHLAKITLAKQNWVRSHEVFVWHDGLLLRIDWGAQVRAFAYDLKCPIAEQSNQHEIYDVRHPRISKDGRYMVSFDLKGQLERMWDLKTNIQHCICPGDRDRITTVGLSKGELCVFTYDYHPTFLTDIIDCIRPVWTFVTGGTGTTNMFVNPSPILLVRRRRPLDSLCQVFGLLIVATAVLIFVTTIYKYSALLPPNGKSTAS